MATIVDPVLIADIVSQLNIRGELAPFEISQVAFPVFDIGRLAGLTGVQKVATPDSENAVRVGAATDFHLPSGYQASQPAEWFNDESLNPGVGDILADTGQLAAGVHVLHTGFSSDDKTTGNIIELQWRNAANSANVASMQFMFLGRGQQNIGPFFVNVAVNQRFRYLNGVLLSGIMATWITTALTNPSIA